MCSGVIRENDAVYAVPGFCRYSGAEDGLSVCRHGLGLNLEWRVQRHLSFSCVLRSTFSVATTSMPRAVVT